MTISELIAHLEHQAPLATQENYDNSGLICGNPINQIAHVLIALDCTEDIIDEAIAKSCNLVIAHHPIVFKGLKSLTGLNYVERTVIKAIKNDIAIYAIHTNLDNYRFGVNYKIATILGLKNPRILAPMLNNLSKIAVYVPIANANEVREAMTIAGAGNIGNYSACSFSSIGTGTFEANESANPFVGKNGVVHQEQEQKIEMVCANEKLSQTIQAMIGAHPYEEVAYDILPLKNKNPYAGAGMIGDLETPIETTAFLRLLKERFRCAFIRHTAICKTEIRKVAFCGGSGSFLLDKAKSHKADIYITGDFKYHEFFDAENQIIIADIGHYESEQFTIDLIGELVKEKSITFAVHFTERNTNPVNYF